MRRLPRWVWLVVAVMLGGAATLMSRSWLAGKPPQEVQVTVRPAPVVVAATDLDAGMTLAARQLKVKEMPQEKVPKGSFARLEEVKDRVTTSSFKEGEAILDINLEPRPTGMVARLSPNKRAMTVKVDEVSGVAGFLSPNDRVDVVVTISPKEATKDLVAKVVLQNLRVLSTGQKIERLPGEKPMVVPTVTLEVTPEEAERLALSTREGQISLGLRGLKDQQAVATPGVTTLQLLGGETEDSSTSPRHQVEVLRRLERESLRF